MTTVIFTECIKTNKYVLYYVIIFLSINFATLADKNGVLNMVCNISQLTIHTDWQKIHFNFFNYNPLLAYITRGNISIALLINYFFSVWLHH